MAQFDEDFADPATHETVLADKLEAQDAGVSGTPSVFVDGRKVSPWVNLQQVLDCLLGYAE